MVIDEFSSPILSSAHEDMSMLEMENLMKKNGFRHLPVLEDGKPVGLICSSAIRVLSNLDQSKNLKARDIMITEPYQVMKGTSIEDVAFEMSRRKIGSALVIDPSGNLDSIFTSIDGLNALVEFARGDIKS